MRQPLLLLVWFSHCILFQKICLSGATTGGITPSTGSSGKAMYFSSRGDHHADIMTWPWETTPTKDFTVEYWVRIVDIHRKEHTILNYAVFDGTQTPMYDSGNELLLTQSRMGFNMWRTNGLFLVCDKCYRGVPIESTGWVHVSMTYNSTSGNVNIFRDDAPALERRVSLESFTAFDVEIVPDGMGMIGQQSSVFNGQYKTDFKGDMILDELRVWDHVRSPDEIASTRHVRLREGTPGLNLAFDWDDHDGDDETVQDTSGNGNTATLGSVVMGPNVLKFDDGDRIARLPTAPRYIYSDAPVAGGEPVVVPVRPDGVDGRQIPIVLPGVDVDGQTLTFEAISLPLEALGTLHLTSSEGALIPFGIGVKTSDPSNRITTLFTLNPTTGLNMLETGSLEERQFTYTVTDPDGNSAEGVVELQLWTMPTPQNLTLRADEDVLTPLPLSELDGYGEMLRPIIVTLPPKGHLYSADYDAPYTYADLKPASALTEIKEGDTTVGKEFDRQAFRSIAFLSGPNDSEGGAIHDPDHSYTSFTYALETADGALRSEEATVTVRVAPVNDVPVPLGQVVELTPDLAYSGTPPSLEGDRKDAQEIMLARTDSDAAKSDRAFYQVTQSPRFGKLWQMEGGEVAQVVMHEPSLEVASYVISAPSVSTQFSRCGEICMYVEGCPPAERPDDDGDEAGGGDNGDEAGGADIGDEAGVADNGDEAGVADIGDEAGVADIGDEAGGGDIGDEAGVADIGDEAGVGDIGDEAGGGDIGDEAGVADIGDEAGGADIGDEAGVADNGDEAGVADIGDEAGVGDIGDEAGGADNGDEAGVADIGDEAGVADNGYDDDDYYNDDYDDDDYDDDYDDDDYDDDDYNDDEYYDDDYDDPIFQDDYTGDTPYNDATVCKDRAYLAEQAVGPPDVFPLAGDFPGGWGPWDPCCKGHQWIVLEFEPPIYLSELVIYEVNKHGGVIEVASAPAYTGNVSTTDWTVLYSRPQAVPTPPQAFTPPLCPPTQLSSVVRLTVDTDADQDAFYNIDAVKRMGWLQMGAGKLLSGSVAYRPVPGIHASSPDDPVVDSFAFSASDCVDMSEEAGVVSIRIPTPSGDAQAATPWETLVSTFQLAGRDYIATEEVVGASTAGDPARWVDAGIRLVLAAEFAATPQSSDSEEEDSFSSSFQSATVKYISGVADAVYLVPRASGNDTTDPPDMESAEPLKVGDKLGEGSDLAVYATLDHGPEVEVGVWVDTGVRTYRTRVVVSLDCPSSLKRRHANGGCDLRIDPCTSDHWEYSVSSCDASTESRHVVYFWKNEAEPGCNGALPPALDIACEMVPKEASTATAVQVISGVGVAVSAFFACFLLIRRAAPAVYLSQIKICLVYCLGSALLCLSLLAWVGPNTDKACMQRPVVFHISFTVMFGSLLIKAERIMAQCGYRKSKKKARGHDSPLSDMALYGRLLILVLADVGILALWMMFERMHSVTEVRNEVGVGEVEVEVCESDSGTISFPTTMMAYKTGMIGYGVSRAYQIRALPSHFNEATRVMLAIYNIAFVGAIVMLLTQGIEMERKSQVLLQALGVGWCSIVSLSILFVPKMLMLKEDETKLLTYVSSKSGPGSSSRNSGQNYRSGDYDKNSSNVEEERKDAFDEI